MKTAKSSPLYALMLCFLLTSCSSVAYLGETYPINQKVEVYYAARDVKREFKVIGHLSNTLITNEESAKEEIIGKAKMVGADGVIFTGFGTTAGKDGSNTATADAIKYTDGDKRAASN